MRRIFGLDVHKSSIFVTVLEMVDGEWKLVQYEFPLTEKGLRAFESQLQADDRIAMEATTNTYYLYDRFLPLVGEVAVANPRKLRWISEDPIKTDRNDSGKLAFLFAIGLLPRVWVPDSATRDDREILAHRTGLIRDSTRIKNRTRALMNRYGVTCPHGDVLSQDARAFIGTIRLRLKDFVRVKLDSLLRHLDWLQEEIKQLDQLIEVRAQGRPEVELLVTIPGVDTLTALTIMAVIGTISRFKRPESLSNYAGMVPRLRSSAGRSHHGRITKAGSKTLRWAVTEIVQLLIRRPGRMKDFYEGLLGHRKAKGTAVTACGRKLLEIIWHMLTTGEPYRESSPTLEKKKQQRRRLRFDTARKAVAQQAGKTDGIIEHLGLLRQLAAKSAVDVSIPPQLRFGSGSRKQAHRGNPGSLCSRL